MAVLRLAAPFSLSLGLWVHCVTVSRL